MLFEELECKKHLPYILLEDTKDVNFWGKNSK